MADPGSGSLAVGSGPEPPPSGPFHTDRWPRELGPDRFAGAAFVATCLEKADTSFLQGRYRPALSLWEAALGECLESSLPACAVLLRLLEAACAQLLDRLRAALAAGEPSAETPIAAATSFLERGEDWAKTCSGEGDPGKQPCSDQLCDLSKQEFVGLHCRMLELQGELRFAQRVFPGARAYWRQGALLATAHNLLDWAARFYKHMAEACIAPENLRPNPIEAVSAINHGLGLLQQSMLQAEQRLHQLTRTAALGGAGTIAASPLDSAAAGMPDPESDELPPVTPSNRKASMPAACAGPMQQVVLLRNHSVIVGRQEAQEIARLQERMAECNRNRQELLMTLLTVFLSTAAAAGSAPDEAIPVSPHRTSVSVSLSATSREQQGLELAAALEEDGKTRHQLAAEMCLNMSALQQRTLAEIRQEYGQRVRLGDDILTVLRHCSKRLIKMVNGMLTAITTGVDDRLIGVPPCKFAVVALGSLGRLEACPYSDLELAVVVEPPAMPEAEGGDPAESPEYQEELEARRAYVRKLCQLLELLVINIGETPPAASGFHIDPALSPNVYPDILINTPAGLARYQIPGLKGVDVIHVMALKDVGLVFGERRLVQQYQARMDQILQASREATRSRVRSQLSTELAGLAEMLEQDWQPQWPAQGVAAADPEALGLPPGHVYSPEFLEMRARSSDVAAPAPGIDAGCRELEVDVKAAFIRPVYFLVGNLALYCGMSTAVTNVFQRLELLQERGVLSKEHTHALHRHLHLAYGLRVRLHLYHGREWDAFSLRWDSRAQQAVEIRPSPAAVNAPASRTSPRRPGAEALGIRPEEVEQLVRSLGEAVLPLTRAVRQCLAHRWGFAFLPYVFAGLRAASRWHQATLSLWSEEPRGPEDALAPEDGQDGAVVPATATREDRCAVFLQGATSGRLPVTRSLKRVLLGLLPPDSAAAAQDGEDAQGEGSSGALFQHGNHRVAEHGRFFFKLCPEFPGVEFAVGRFLQLGFGHGAPQTELLKLVVVEDPPSAGPSASQRRGTVSSLSSGAPSSSSSSASGSAVVQSEPANEDGGNRGQRLRVSSFPVIMSEKASGPTLHRVLRRRPDLLRGLDMTCFSQLVLQTLVVRPEDAKPDNWVLVPHADPAEDAMEARGRSTPALPTGAASGVCGSAAGVGGPGDVGGDLVVDASEAVSLSAAQPPPGNNGSVPSPPTASPPGWSAAQQRRWLELLRGPLASSGGTEADDMDSEMIAEDGASAGGPSNAESSSVAPPGCTRNTRVAEAQRPCSELQLRVLTAIRNAMQVCRHTNACRWNAGDHPAVVNGYQRMLQDCAQVLGQTGFRGPQRRIRQALAEARTQPAEQAGWILDAAMADFVESLEAPGGLLADSPEQGCEDDPAIQLSVSVSVSGSGDIRVRLVREYAACASVGDAQGACGSRPTPRSHSNHHAQPQQQQQQHQKPHAQPSQQKQLKSACADGAQKCRSASGGPEDEGVELVDNVLVFDALGSPSLEGSDGPLNDEVGSLGSMDAPPSLDGAVPYDQASPSVGPRKASEENLSFIDFLQLYERRGPEALRENGPSDRAASSSSRAAGPSSSSAERPQLRRQASSEDAAGQESQPSPVSSAGDSSPEDDLGAAAPAGEEEEEEIPLPVRLVCVDNDRAFVPNVTQQLSAAELKELRRAEGPGATTAGKPRPAEGGRKRTLARDGILAADGSEVVTLKSIILCLDQMLQPIDPRARQMFLMLDKTMLLRVWIAAVQDADLEAKQLFNDAERQQLYQAYLSRDPQQARFGSVIPLRLATNTVMRLYDTLNRLQQFLMDNERATHLELLRLVEPRLGCMYAAALNQYRDPYLRFRAVCRGAYAMAKLPEEPPVAPVFPQQAYRRTPRLASASSCSAAQGPGRSPNTHPGLQKCRSNPLAPLPPQPRRLGGFVSRLFTVSVPGDGCGSVGAQEARREALAAQRDKPRAELRLSTRLDTRMTLGTLLGSVPADISVRSSDRNKAGKTGGSLAAQDLALELSMSMRLMDTVGQACAGLPRGVSAEFAALRLLPHCQQQVIGAINWASLGSKQQHAAIKILLEHLSPNVRQLNLRGLCGITRSQALALVKKCQGLVSLDVSGCANICNVALQVLCNHMPYLEVLTADHLPLVTSFDNQKPANWLGLGYAPVEPRLPLLRVLRMRQCRHLKRLQADFPLLEEIDVSGSPALANGRSCVRVPPHCRIRGLPMGATHQCVRRNRELLPLSMRAGGGPGETSELEHARMEQLDNAIAPIEP